MDKLAKKINELLPGAFWRNRRVKTLLVICLLVNIGSWLLVYVSRGIEKQLVPIHYSTAIGIDRLGQFNELYILPTTGLAILAVNAMISWFAWKNQAQALFLIGGTLLVEIIIITSIFYLKRYFL